MSSSVLTTLVDATSELLSQVIQVSESVFFSTTKAAGAVESVSSQSLDALKEEITKQELRLKFEVQQAKIAQELAIAQRILNAESVEIEEFYDSSLKGQVGARADESAVSLGFGSEGKSVVKRIYKFKGSFSHRSSSDEETKNLESSRT